MFGFTTRNRSFRANVRDRRNRLKKEQVMKRLRTYAESCLRWIDDSQLESNRGRIMAGVRDEAKMNKVRVSGIETRELVQELIDKRLGPWQWDGCVARLKPEHLKYRYEALAQAA